ncbi:MAG TPA: hypothetical protein VM100_12790 [Longimicrobiales bacterium]|nr:hypothetical protein [Longimicrobiales bacterium]
MVLEIREDDFLVSVEFMSGRECGEWSNTNVASKRNRSDKKHQQSSQCCSGAAQPLPGQRGCAVMRFPAPFMQQRREDYDRQPNRCDDQGHGKNPSGQRKLIAKKRGGLKEHVCGRDVYHDDF